MTTENKNTNSATIVANALKYYGVEPSNIKLIELKDSTENLGAFMLLRFEKELAILETKINKLVKAKESLNEKENELVYKETIASLATLQDKKAELEAYYTSLKECNFTIKNIVAVWSYGLDKGKDLALENADEIRKAAEKLSRYADSHAAVVRALVDGTRADKTFYQNMKTELTAAYQLLLSDRDLHANQADVMAFFISYIIFQCKTR